MRIGKKDLETILNQLNSLALKRYELESVYGQWRLTTKGGSLNITPLLSKRELFYVIKSLINFINEERRKET